MKITLEDRIVENVRQKPTEELLAIWTDNDREQWSDAAFEAIYQTLSEREISVPPQAVFVPPPPRYKGVGGWLLLFCISLTVLNPLGLLGQFGSQSRLGPLSMIDGLLELALAAFSIFAGISLWFVRPGAVKKAEAFLWCSLAYTLLIIILPFMAGLPTSARETMISAVGTIALRNLAYFAVWLSYLHSSKRVKATYSM